MSELKSTDKSTSWFVVFNNPAEYGFDGSLKDISEQIADMWIDGKETRSCAISGCISKAGLQHLHLVLEDTNSTRFSTVKEFLPKAHIEATKGSKKEAEDYINKNGKYQEKGETVVHIARRGEIKANQGKRTDIDDIDMYIQKGLTPNEIMDIKFSYRKYEKSITEAFFRKRYLETPTHRNLLVYWHTGESGSGKSYTYVILCEQYGEDEVYLVTDYQDPFGKYNGERIIVLDEFRGQIPYYKLLNEILSNYRVQVHSRYTNRYALWTEVHICTVFTPQMCYQNMVQTNQNVDGIDQLNRRITLMVYHHKDENGKYYRFDLPMRDYKGIEDLKEKALKASEKQISFDEMIEQCKNDIPIFDE